MTSNLGSQRLLEGVDADGGLSETAREEAMAALRRHFRPEFLNRVDEVAMFTPLSRREIGAIVRLMLTRLEERLGERHVALEGGRSRRTIAYVSEELRLTGRVLDTDGEPVGDEWVLFLPTGLVPTHVEAEAIKTYETKRRVQAPWLFDVVK